MCLVILAHRPDSDYPLVVAANRDEFFNRETDSARFWEAHPQVLAGRDLQAGGSWMGITREGRFAAITNYRDPDQTGAAPRSRGELTMDFLLSDASPRDYLYDIATRGDDYAGFNLLLRDGSELWYYSNSLAAPATQPQRLSPGIYGLSNALLDTPWPKVELGKTRLQQTLQSSIPDHNKLAAVVSDRRTYDREQLHPLGLEHAMDELLSAQFISGNNLGYGTRSRTTLWLSSEGEAHWREASFKESGAEAGAVLQHFKLR